MAIIDNLKETDLTDLQELFAQSNEDSKTAYNFEFVQLPDGQYISYVIDLKIRKNDKDELRAAWTFEVSEIEGEEYEGVRQYKSDNLKDKKAMTRFLQDVRRFGVEFESLDELYDSIAENVIGQPCVISLETAAPIGDFTEGRQFLNIIVETDEEEDEE